MIRLLESQPFTAVKFKGDTYDCGDKVGFLLANLAFGLDRPEVAGALKQGLKELLSKE